MAFRIETAACLIVLAAVAAQGAAQTYRYTVRHDHWRKGAEGVLTFDSEGFAFDEPGKKSQHSRRWKYEEIQHFELTPQRLRIITYDDVGWQLGRDREYLFDRLPKEMAQELYPLLSAHLDARFIAEVPNAMADTVWSAPAKMLHGWSGANGLLKAGADRIVFASARKSRTWRYSDIQGITTEGPLEFSISALDGVTRFQLKQVLPEERYNELWRRISQANGLKTFHSQLESRHHE